MVDLIPDRVLGTYLLEQRITGSLAKLYHFKVEINENLIFCGEMCNSAVGILLFRLACLQVGMVKVIKY